MDQQITATLNLVCGKKRRTIVLALTCVHAGLRLHVWSARHVVVGDDRVYPKSHVYTNTVPT